MSKGLFGSVPKLAKGEPSCVNWAPYIFPPLSANEELPGHLCGLALHFA